jgi:CubicO group peptidase (beta-lactamase class C family)
MRQTVHLASEPAAALGRAARGFGIDGMAVALAAPGRRALWTFGESRAGSGHLVDARTWFSVASLGKHVTAAAVLDLASGGALDLRAPIGRYLPDVPTAWSDRSVLALLHHTSGLPEYLAYRPDEAVPSARSDFMATYGSLAAAFGEGEGWIYTNTNYILAGMLVAQLRGAPYAEAVESLFDRVGCDGGAKVAGPDWARRVNEEPAMAGVPDPGSARREVIGDGDICFTPAGALAWLEGLLDGRLLDAEQTSEMFAPAQQRTGRPALYGCGWFLEPLRGAMLAHHGGHFDGWTAMGILHPGLGSGVVAMCNQAPGHTRHIRYLAQLALEAFCPGSTPLCLPVIEEDDPALAARIRAQLLRAPGAAPEMSGLADELRRVAEHGSAVRTVPNLNTGVEPDDFELVERHAQPGGQWRRYRLHHADRVEHVFVGVTPQGLLHWAWGL